MTPHFREKISHQCLPHLFVHDYRLVLGSELASLGSFVHLSRRPHHHIYYCGNGSSSTSFRVVISSFAEDGSKYVEAVTQPRRLVKLRTNILMIAMIALSEKREIYAYNIT
jgi:hypothetical protein